MTSEERGSKVKFYGVHACLNAVYVGVTQLRKRLEDEGLSVKQREELEWEIRLYEWITRQPDATHKAEVYLRMRFESGCGTMPKREVVERLGWNV